MSRRAALAAAPVNGPRSIFPPPPPPSLRKMQHGEAIPFPLSIHGHAIGAHEVAARSSTLALAGIDCSDEGCWCSISDFFAHDGADGTMSDRAVVTLLPACNKVCATSIGFEVFARGSGIDTKDSVVYIDLGRLGLGEGGRLRGAAFSLPLHRMLSARFDCAPCAAWACCHGAQPLPDVSLRAFRGRGGHDLVRADAGAAMRDHAAATLLATLRAFAGSAYGAQLGRVVPRAPALVTDKPAWQIPANRGVVMGISTPCRTGRDAAFYRNPMVSAAARPYSTWGAPRWATAASYPCVHGGAVKFAGPSSCDLSTYTAASAWGWRSRFARGAWGPYSASRSAVFGVSVGSVGSLVLLCLGYRLRELFKEENKINEENLKLKSLIGEKEKYIEEQKARWVQLKVAPGKAP